MLDDASLLDRQIALEQEMLGRGQQSFQKQLEFARKHERGTGTQAGIHLLKQTVDPLAKAISKFVADAFSGKPGPRATAAVILKDLDPHMVAYMTAKTLIDCLATLRNKSMSSAASAIAKSIEIELRIAAFEEREPALWGTIERRLRDHGVTYHHAERVVIYTSNKYGIEWDGWNRAEGLHVGTTLVHLAAEVTGFCDLKTVVHGKGKTMVIIEPTDTLVEWINDRNGKLALLSPMLAPMLVPPRQWKGLTGGGYRSDAILRTSLVKRMSKAHRALLQTADLTVVHGALNSLQNTAWRINARVLDVAQTLWDRGGDMPGAPGREDDPLPEQPADIETNEEALKAWKHAARATRERNASSRSKRLAITQTLEQGEEMVAEAAIYFPYQLDFRGRAYCRTTAISPQGNDLTKALLTFSKGKALGDERAVGWLAIHGANCFGVDKVSHEARIDWVFEHADDIISCARDPLDNRWWMDADGGDSAWSFLAFCFEWADFSDQGFEFESSLPIAMDGSCNGLQHYSAMLRDPIGGAAVNLMPSAAPQDIYGEVAKVVMRNLEALAKDPNNERAWVADAWFRFGLNRKTTKRQVMVLPYGGTQNSCRTYTVEAIEERIKAGAENPFGDDLRREAMKLGGNIWDAIGEVVIAARAAMEWLREVAKVANEAAKPLSWTTPSGFVAFQDYREMKQRQVKTRFNGRLIYFLMEEATDKLDKQRQSAGISPNFVHSFDGAAMALTIVSAAGQGVQSFAMIHDSYGTHAADSDMLAACLRLEFVRMYLDNDVLRQFRDGIAEAVGPKLAEKLPTLPDQGDLDLNLVLESPFFFT